MRNIPITAPFFSKDEENEARKAIRSGWIAQGKKTLEFEGVFAGYAGSNYAIATNSCTTALHLLLIASGIKENDEVIVPSFTHPATANAVLYLKAKPVFVDIDLETYNINAGQIKEKITRKTKAIIPVHLFGLPAEMDEIIRISKKYGVKIIEDAACALGSEYKNKKIGSFNSPACFSFHPRKIITTGEGGMITTNSRKQYELLNSLRSHGVSLSDLKHHSSKKLVFPEFTGLGYNYRITDIQSAIGIAQMKKLPFILKERRRMARYYNAGLSDINSIETPYEPPYAKHSYQTYVIRIGEKSNISRDEIMIKLMKKGISTRKGTHAVHNEPFYRNYFKYKKTDYPNSYKADKTTVALPLYPAMSKSIQDYVILSLRKILCG